MPIDRRALLKGTAVAAAGLATGRWFTHRALASAVPVLLPPVEGRFRQMTFLGSSGCGYSTSDEVREAVPAIAARFRETAERDGWEFVTHGIAVEWDVGQGVDYLGSLLRWDQISVGRNWGNEMIISHYWSRGESPVTPTLILSERTISSPQAGETATTLIASEPTPIAVVTGMSGLQRLQRGEDVPGWTA